MDILITYKLKAKDNSIYISKSYTLEEIENSCDIKEMIWENESECVCSFNENNNSCDCCGYLGTWNDEVEFEIEERILNYTKN
jgi:hypothetical protein